MNLHLPLSRTLTGVDLPNPLLDGSPFVVSGAAPGGFNERADVVYAAADGTDLNDFWAEVQQTVAMRNAQRNRLIDLLTFRVDGILEEVTLPGTADFEKASEYGLPKGIRTTVNRFWRGFDFDFYDLAIRYTWMYIAEADVRQLRQLNNTALEADNRLVFSRVMRTLFNPANGSGITDQNLPVTQYKFYNADGEVPPPVGTTTFLGTHTHYTTSQTLSASATLVPDVVEDMNSDFDAHGYKYEAGYRKILWVNEQEYNIIRTWRVATGAPWDFIPDPSTYGGGFYEPTDRRLVGAPTDKVPGQVGTYGPWHVVKEDYIPAGYVVGIISGGADNIGNPIGIREHKNPAFQGLKIIPGDRAGYPLIESYYQRGIGTGIRHRGAGFLVQVTGNASYAVPAAYAG